MERSKLIELLRTFSKKNLREFDDYINSPFFNKSDELKHFYQYLRKNAPHFPIHKIKREYAYKKLYPNLQYDDKHMNYLMSFTLKLAEQYLGLAHFQESGMQEHFNILTACVDRNLEKHYQNRLTKAKAELQGTTLRDKEFYYNQYLLANVANRHFLKQRQRKFDDRLQQAADNLDLFYLVNKLKYTCEIFNRKALLSADYELKFVQEMLDHLEQTDYSEHPAIGIYYRILLSFTDAENPNHFKELKHLLAENASKFPKQELKDMYTVGLNYCIKQVNQGKQAYLAELFELYERCLEKDVLMENNFLSPWAYKNVIGVGLRLKKFDWTENFIVEYNDQLEEQFRENALNYNMAELNYYKESFETAMQHLNLVEFSDIYYALDTKKMMMKIFFRLGEIDPLLSLMSSFSVYLKRNKLISNTNRQAYQNFIYAMSQMVKLPKVDKAEVIEKIKELSPLADKRWLLDVLEKKPVASTKTVQNSS